MRNELKGKQLFTNCRQRRILMSDNFIGSQFGKTKDVNLLTDDECQYYLDIIRKRGGIIYVEADFNPGPGTTTSGW